MIASFTKTITEPVNTNKQLVAALAVAKTSPITKQLLGLPVLSNFIRDVQNPFGESFHMKNLISGVSWQAVNK